MARYFFTTPHLHNSLSPSSPEAISNKFSKLRSADAIESSDSRVVRASEAMDSDLIPCRVNPMTLKVIFTASLLDSQC